MSIPSASIGFGGRIGGVRVIAAKTVQKKLIRENSNRLGEFATTQCQADASSS